LRFFKALPTSVVFFHIYFWYLSHTQITNTPALNTSKSLTQENTQQPRLPGKSLRLELTARTSPAVLLQNCQVAGKRKHKCPSATPEFCEFSTFSEHIEINWTY